MRHISVLVFLALMLSGLTAFAQTNSFRLASYNSLRYSTSNIDQRHPDFRLIINEIDPDILVLQELSGRSASAMFLDSVMNFSNMQYDTASFVDGNDLDISLFYKTAKFQFIRTQTYGTALRDIYHYQLRPVNSADTLHVFGVHLKASPSSADEALRAAEVDTLRKYTDQLPHGAYSIVCGDFNIYGSTEAAYTRLLDNTAGNDGHFIDQINLSGTWNNAAYAPYHTQSPRTTQFNGGASGGMDDRFDLILMSRAIDSSGGISYTPGSMTAFGNDGQHYNLAINSAPTNSAVSASVANALHQASDHIPVFADFQYDSTGSNTTATPIDTILLAEFDRENNTTGNCVASAQNTYQLSDLTTVALCRSGVTANTGGDFNSRGWPQTNAIDLNAYYSVTVTPNTGRKVFLSQIKIRLDRSNQGPDEVRIRSSIDGYGADIANINGLSASGETRAFHIDLESTSAVEFRIYAFNASGSAGTFDVEGFAGEQLTDPGIALYGYVLPEIVWDGTQWNTGSSPAGNLANGKIIVQKGNKAQVTATVSEVGSIEVQAGAKLEVASGNSITLTDTLYIEADGTNGPGQVSGDINAHLKYTGIVRGSTARWHSLAFPVTGTLTDVSLGNAALNTSANSAASQVNVWYYDAQTTDPNTDQGTWTRAENLNKGTGIGYGVYLGPPHFGNYPLFFEARGTYSRSGAVSVYLDNGVAAADQGWNLVPNPFTAPLDWTALKNDNATLNATFYVDSAHTWKFHNGSTGNASRYIHPGQSFFVKVSSAGTLNYNQTQVTLDQNTRLYKNGLAQITIAANNGLRKDAHYIALENGLSQAVDPGFDGLKKKNTGKGALNVYSTDPTGNSYAINGLPPQGVERIPLVLEADRDTLVEMRFSLEQLSHFTIRWVDPAKGDTLVLTDGLHISVPVLSGNNPFLLLLDQNGQIGMAETSLSKVKIRNELHRVVIENGSGLPLTAAIFDLSGRKLKEYAFTEALVLRGLQGMYLLHILNASHEVLKSKVVVIP